jgi:hypothetical protein
MLAQDVEKRHLNSHCRTANGGPASPLLLFVGSCQSELKRTLRQPLQLAARCLRLHFAGVLRLHLPVMVNASFHRTSAYGFEMVTQLFCGFHALFVNQKFTPSQTIQILRKFSERKTLKIYRLVV